MGSSPSPAPRWLSAIVLAAVVGPAARAAAQDEAAAPDDDSAAVAPPPPAVDKTADKTLDIDELRREYMSLRDRLFRSRARAATVASALYSTRLSIKLNYRSARFYSIDRATVRLDGANVYDDTEGAIAANQATRFDGYVAPGRHVITIRIEATAKDDPRFATVVEHQFSVVAEGGKDLLIRADADDGGDIAAEWKKEGEGTYKLHVDVSVRAEKRGDAPGSLPRSSARPRRTKGKPSGTKTASR
jgi:hypothetical protein